MKRRYVYFIFLMATMAGYSQESPVHSLPIPSDNPPIPATPVVSRTETLPDYKLEKKNEFSMYEKKKLMTAGDYVTQKWTADAKADDGIKGDQSLGNFKTRGSFVQLYCRDYQYVDGDRVSVLVNGNMIVSNLTLGGNFTPVMVELKPGFNTIEIKALNQGSSGPNTAAFKVIGSEGETITTNEWNLMTGYTANMIVVKQ